MQNAKHDEKLIDIFRNENPNSSAKRASIPGNLSLQNSKTPGLCGSPLTPFCKRSGEPAHIAPGTSAQHPRNCKYLSWSMLIFTFIVVAACWSVAAGNSVCTLDTMEAMVSSISNIVIDSVEGGLTAIRSISMQMKHLHSTLKGPPSVVDSTTNRVQRALWNNHKWFLDLNTYIGWENSAFMGYSDNDGNTYLSFKANYTTEFMIYGDLDSAGQTLAYSQIRIKAGYNTTSRPWYTAAKAMCLPDNNGYYDCGAVVTPLYVSQDSSHSLTLTVAQAIPNYEGKPLFAYNEGVYMYGLQGQSDVSDISTKSAFAGVIATDIPCSLFNDALKEEVDAGGASVAYIMESSYDLVAVSDGSDVAVIDGVNALRLSAQQSKSPLIASTSQYLVSNKFLSDNTLVWNDVAITVRKYFKNNAKWYIVVVSSYSPAESCDFRSQKLVLADVVHSTDTLLNEAKLAGRMLQGGINNEMFPNSKAPPMMGDLFKLNSSTVNIQNMIIAVGEAFPRVSTIYVGYADDTCVGYLLDTSAEDDISFNSFTFVDGSDHIMHNYYACADSGYAANPDYVGPSSSSPGYYPTQQLWYINAAEKQEPVWSPPYFFMHAELGMTFSIPFYDNDGNLAGVIGIDIGFARASATLRKYGNSGTAYYLMETNESPLKDNTQQTAEYSMLMSSSDASIVNDAGDEQVKAWDADGVKDYLVATSATYMKDSEFVYNGEFSTGPLECSVFNYHSHGLHWRFVGVSYQYPAGTPTTDSSNGNGGDNKEAPSASDNYDVILNISNTGENLVVALLMIIILHFLVSVATFFQGGFHRALPVDSGLGMK